jgi:DNA-binding NtrC family response regulator
MTMRAVVALGQDEYWLSAVHRSTAGWAGKPRTVKCPGSLLKCISSLPKPDLKSVVLVDASGQDGMEEIIAALLSAGWKYVIVVAANYNAKGAAAVLRANGYDYWPKTYEDEDIRNRVQVAFEEIAKKEERKKTEQKRSKR